MLLPLATAFVLALVLTGLIRVLAPRAGLVDPPRADRWHSRPVPRLGGAAVFAAFLASVSIFLPRFGSWPPSGEVAGALAGMAAIFLVGLVDDVVKLENRPKLLLLIMAACVPVALGVRFGTFAPVVAVPLTILWVLGATNAMNWLDNMDGVAGGVAAIAAGMLLLVAWASGGGGQAGAASVPALFAAALLGASLGFLVHNFPPARIFMGDAGSGFLGMALAVTATLGSSRDVTNVTLAVLTPGLILAVPIFDSLRVAWLRVTHGRSVFQGGRDHPSHRLVLLGLSERRAVLLLYGLSALSGVAGLLAWQLGVLPGVVLGALIGLGFVALGVVLAEVRVYGAEDAPPGMTRLPGPVRNLRWLASIGLDLVLLCVAFVGAHLLRYEWSMPPSTGGSGGTPASWTSSAWGRRRLWRAWLPWQGCSC